MKSFWNSVRSPEKSPLGKTAVFCAVFLSTGAAAGVVSKLSDLYVPVLADVTSQMSVWIFIGVLICAFTKSPARAAAYVFLFCAGMVAAYYVTAELCFQAGLSVFTGALKAYFIGWGIVAGMTPVLAYAAWYAAGSGAFSWLIRIGAAVVTLLCAAFLFGGVRIADVIFTAGIFAVTIIGSRVNIKENSHGENGG